MIQRLIKIKAIIIAREFFKARFNSAGTVSEKKKKKSEKNLNPQIKFFKFSGFSSLYYSVINSSILAWRIPVDREA